MDNTTADLLEEYRKRGPEPMPTMLGWHWLLADRRLIYGTRELVEAGRTYTAEGPLVLCHNGMHASKRALDALTYAPGPIICRVRLGGTILHDSDKSVATTRTVLWMADATDLLHEFALACGHEALGWQAAQGEEPDQRLWDALEVKEKWMRGAASDTDLAAARAAAGAAARGAARAAAWDAAWDAAGAAARGAAGAAAWAAAGAAAGGAARAAAWDAAWDAQNIVLELLLGSLR
jgi:hypothetical protein